MRHFGKFRARLAKQLAEAGCCRPLAKNNTVESLSVVQLEEKLMRFHSFMSQKLVKVFCTQAKIFLSNVAFAVFSLEFLLYARRVRKYSQQGHMENYSTASVRSTTAGLI